MPGLYRLTAAHPAGLAQGQTNLTVLIKNFGSANISNIPVTVTITNPDNTVTTLNETYAFTLAPAAEDNFILQGTFNTLSGATYKILPPPPISLAIRL
jgi:hypothetical protein